MKKRFVVLALPAAITSLCFADVYKYVDPSSGHIFYTDKPEKMYKRIIVTPFSDYQCDPPLSLDKNKSSWDYSESIDEMTGHDIELAKVSSVNVTLSGKWKSGNLIIRQHPRLGVDAYFTINDGQFVCGDNGCDILIRFDSNKPVSYEAIRTNDQSGSAIFIKEKDDFIDRLRCARRLRIEATFFHEATRIMEFDVTGLSQADDVYNQRHQKNRKPN